MQRNIEIKARLRDRAALLAKLKALVPEGKLEQLHQEDTFYKSATGRLKLRDFGTGAGELIWYQRPDEKGPKTSSYERLVVPDPKALDRVMTRSVGLVSKVIKTRLVGLVGQSRVHVDQVVGLGEFVEIEVVLKPDQTQDQGKAIMDDLTGKLGIESGDLIDVAYADLLAQAARAERVTRVAGLGEFVDIEVVLAMS